MDIQVKPNEYGVGDIAFVGGEPVIDDTLQTSVYLSLYTHRGWWGDPNFGSNLYLLAREKFIPGIEKKAKSWCDEALQWLVDEGVAKSFSVTAERSYTKDGLGIVVIVVEVTRVDTGAVEKYSYNWEAQKNGVQ